MQTESSTSSTSRALFVQRFSDRKTHIMSMTVTYIVITIIRRALRQSVRVAVPRF